VPLVAQTIYQESYDGLGDVWGKLHSWVEAQGFRPHADLWECYIRGPESNPDSASWQTELNLPLTGSGKRYAVFRSLFTTASRIPAFTPNGRMVFE